MILKQIYTAAPWFLRRTAEQRGASPKRYNSKYELRWFYSDEKLLEDIGRDRSVACKGHWGA